MQLSAQGVTPEQQVKIDSMMAYIQRQAKNNKPVDQRKIDSMNTVIRALNPKTIVKDSSVKIISDTTHEITKQSMAGTSFTVPQGKQWKVKRVFVNDGGSYNILASSLKFDKPLKEGEKLFVPTWCAEAELLNGDKSAFTYIFKIEETILKKQ